jgi:hypothetical protein
VTDASSPPTELLAFTRETELRCQFIRPGCLDHRWSFLARGVGSKGNLSYDHVHRVTSNTQLPVFHVCFPLHCLGLCDRFLTCGTHPLWMCVKIQREGGERKILDRINVFICICDTLTVTVVVISEKKNKIYWHSYHMRHQMHKARYKPNTYTHIPSI